MNVKNSKITIEDVGGDYDEYILTINNDDQLILSLQDLLDLESAIRSYRHMKAFNELTGTTNAI